MTKPKRRIGPEEIAAFYAKRIAEVESGEDELYRPPAFLMYAKEWLTGDATSSFDSEQNGWYVNLLCAAWNSRPQATLPANIEDKLKNRCKYFQDLLLSTSRLRNVLRNVLRDKPDDADLVEMTADYERRFAEVMSQFEPVPGFPALVHHQKLTTCCIKMHDEHEEALQRTRKASAVRNGLISSRQRNEGRNVPRNDTRDEGRNEAMTTHVTSVIPIPKRDLPKNFAKRVQNPTQQFDPVAALPPEEKNNSRGSRMYRGWLPPNGFEKDFCKLETPDVDYQHELKLFIDHWTSTPGKAGLKLDWVATFRNWLRKAQKWSNKKGASAFTALAELDKKDSLETPRNGNEPDNQLLIDDLIFDEDEKL